MRIWVGGVLLLAAVSACWAQENDAAKANEIWKTGDRVAALPYYEKLSAEFPNEWLYAERLSISLRAKADYARDAAERRALLERMRDAAKLAVKDGDTATFMALGANLDVDEAMKEPPRTPAVDLFKEGEKLFGTGHYAEAVDKYAEAAEADPTIYEAPLYAGDAAYANKDLKTAAKWFERAIKVDPDRETAYRYWGDAMLKYGDDPMAARDKFIDAIVAQPYDRLAWQGLQQWAQVMKAVLTSPKIELPAAPARDSKNTKNIVIRIDPNAPPGKSGAVWMGYQMERSLWMNEKFEKAFPGQPYRHTLREEDSALSLAVTVTGELKLSPNELDQSLRTLVDLQKAGMLDCWILINGADEGIAQDYDVYRKDHRQLLHDYVGRFVVHGGVTPRE